MILKIFRHTFNTEGDRNIIGDLFINDTFFCHTLEDEIRYNNVKVKHKTAIKAGRYKVVVTYSNRFKRMMPLLLDVPMFEGIRIHGGNNSDNSSGCPLVAYNTDYKKIWGTAEKKLTKILQDTDEDIYIDIVNSFLTYDRELKRLDR